MFLIKDPRKTATIIMAHAMPEEVSQEGEGEESLDEALKDEAEHLLKSIKAGDAAGVALALKDICAMCFDEYERQPHEEAEEPEEAE